MPSLRIVPDMLVVAILLLTDNTALSASPRVATTRECWVFNGVVMSLLLL